MLYLFGFLIVIIILVKTIQHLKKNYSISKSTKYFKEIKFKNTDDGR
jgi:tellurite resistance protein TehA-like permease